VNSIEDQLFISEIKAKLLLILHELKHDNDYLSRKDIAEDLAEVLDYISEIEPTRTFQEMIHKEGE